MKAVYYVSLSLFLVNVQAFVNFGPAIVATKGEIWPKPQEQETSDSFLVLKPDLFQFKLLTGNDCSILRDNFIRYQVILGRQHGLVSKNLVRYNHVSHKKSWTLDDKFSGYMLALNVYLNGKCSDGDYPTQNMDESYTLEIRNVSADLYANSAWGILRGLESFSQSFYLADDAFSLRINLTTISDHPRFGYRGLLLDTARHYIPVKKILATLDAMSYNKLNVFHWHIVDDQSFPYVSQKFPELSEKGAFRPYLVYSVSDVKLIIEYARLRGIRVIPEFDTPGHTLALGPSHRELLTECYENDTKNGDLGPVDPSKYSTYHFMRELFTEVSQVFPDNFIHLGGDEVEFDCWKSNPNITEFMDDKNITSYEKLEGYYIQKIIDIADELKQNTIVWEEVFSNGVKLPNQTLVHVWKSDTWELVLDQVTQSGSPALLSACWYLDYLQTGGDWQEFYSCEPFDFNGTSTQFTKILGGEACMWTESVDESNVISRVWPRASAAAERLWSDQAVNSTTDAEARIEEHYCRLKLRGIEAQPPNGPGFCP